MHFLSWTKLATNFVLILVVCITKSEQRIVSQYQNDTATITSRTTSSGDQIQGYDLIKSFPFLRAAIPNALYECITTHGIMRCMKVYVLRKMEEHKYNQRTGNLTRDFLKQFADEQNDIESLHAERYDDLSDNELTKRLLINFQLFFKNRDIKLHFLPGIVVRIVPSKDNNLKFSFKKKTKSQHKATGRALKTADETDENVSIETATPLDAAPIGELKNPVGLIKKRKIKKEAYSYKTAILQMAVPIMVMPAILLGSILPFLLPVLKMATVMTLLMNHSAFIAALIYAARTHANAQDEQHISYGSHPTYH